MLGLGPLAQGALVDVTNGVATPATQISGMAWFTPPDILPRPRLVNPHPGPAIALTPATLPPQISGMAWFVPTDRQRPAVKITVESPPAIALTPDTLPPRIAGMAWFEPPDSYQPRRSFVHPPPAFQQVIVSVTTVPQGWFVQSTDTVRKPAPLDWPTPILRPVTQFIGVPWLTATDVAPRKLPPIDWPVMVPSFSVTIGRSFGWFVPLETLRQRRQLSQDVPSFVSITASLLPIWGWQPVAEWRPSRLSPIDWPSEIPRTFTQLIGVPWMRPFEMPFRKASAIGWEVMRMPYNIVPLTPQGARKPLQSWRFGRTQTSYWKGRPN